MYHNIINKIWIMENRDRRTYDIIEGERTREKWNHKFRAYVQCKFGNSWISETIPLISHIAVDHLLVSKSESSVFLSQYLSFICLAMLNLCTTILCRKVRVNESKCRPACVPADWHTTLLHCAVMCFQQFQILDEYICYSSF